MVKEDTKEVRILMNIGDFDNIENVIRESVRYDVYYKAFRLRKVFTNNETKHFMIDSRQDGLQDKNRIAVDEDEYNMLYGLHEKDKLFTVELHGKEIRIDNESKIYIEKIEQLGEFEAFYSSEFEFRFDYGTLEEYIDNINSCEYITNVNILGEVSIKQIILDKLYMNQ